MAGVTRVPRSRGGVSGVLLILLGAWGGLAPFVGPYFHFAYTPDKAWAYTSGRLWLSIVPGAAALVGGLLVTFASHRAVGIFGAALAVLGGVWFIVGGAVTRLVVVNVSISPGVPLARSVGSISATNWQILEGLGLFTGTGILILFFGALALGRFAVVGVKDAALAEPDGPSLVAGEYPPAYSGADPAGQYVSPGSQYPGNEYSGSGSQYPTTEETLAEHTPSTHTQTTQTQTTQAPTEPGQPPSDLFPPATKPAQDPSASDTGPLRRPGFS
jgi:hypothetical protein